MIVIIVVIVVIITVVIVVIVIIVVIVVIVVIVTIVITVEVRARKIRTPFSPTPSIPSLSGLPRFPAHYTASILYFLVCLYTFRFFLGFSPPQVSAVAGSDASLTRLPPVLPGGARGAEESATSSPGGPEGRSTSSRVRRWH